MPSSSAPSLPHPPTSPQSTFDPVDETCAALLRVLHRGPCVEGRSEHAQPSPASKFAPGAYPLEPPAKRQRADDDAAGAKLRSRFHVEDYWERRHDDSAASVNLARRLHGEYEVEDKWEGQKAKETVRAEGEYNWERREDDAAASVNLARRLQGEYDVEDKWEGQKAKETVRADDESAAVDAARALYARRLERDEVEGKSNTKDEVSTAAAFFDKPQPPKQTRTTNKKNKASSQRPNRSTVTKPAVKKSVTKAPPRKTMSTVARNIKAVITNDISEWARSSTFDAAGEKVDEAVFGIWQTWFTRQIKCRFQRQQKTIQERADGIGLG